MIIEDYFSQIQQLISSNYLIKYHSIVYQKRDDFFGYIKGKIQFSYESWLYLTEYVDVESEIDRGKYSYQYMNQDNQLIFRYDNAPHHQKLKLSSFPHHKHDRRDDNIIASNAPNLSNVLQ